jgi:hypothetical protein
MPKVEAAGIKVINPRDLRSTRTHKIFLETHSYDTEFRDGFWTFVVERFFIIEELFRDEAITSAIQLEGDNLLYANGDQLFTRLKAFYSGIAAPFDHVKRAVPGFVYIASKHAISQFNAFIINQLGKAERKDLNDMELLGKYYIDIGRPQIDSLPVLPPFYDGSYTNCLGEHPEEPGLFKRHANDLEYIFDANALGQYIGGVDPRNTGGLDSVGFINETAMHNFDSFFLKRSDNDRKPVISHRGREFPLANLHVHSKNLRAFRLASLGSNRGHSFHEFPTSPFHIPASEYITAERVQSLAEIIITDRRTFNFYYPNSECVTNKFLFIDDFIQSGENRAAIFQAQSSAVIFVHTHLLDTFLDHILPLLVEPFVLLCHASDDSPSEQAKEKLSDARILHLFAQNLNFRHPKASRLPIGIANEMFPHGDYRTLRHWAEARPLKKLLTSARFSLETQHERYAVKAALEEAGIKVYGEKVSHNLYISEIAASLFTISPPGNGLDCHRTWEAIYLDSIPVVRDHLFDHFFPSLPAIPIEAWTDVSPSFLRERLFQISQPSLRNYGPATISYWHSRINEAAYTRRGLNYDLR